MSRRFLGGLLALFLTLPLSAAGADDEAETFNALASTTSTRDSGLLDAILPLFREASGVEVRVIAVGTGRALELGRRGDVDALLVHDRASEDAFVADGDGLFRRDVMFNDFVLIGPSADPADIAGLASASEALGRIAAKRAPFLSRGDDSGTHKAELRLWRAAGVDPSGASGSWYRETGNGMGATLNTATELDAYVLTDRGTWLSFRNRGDLVILLEGDPPLLNPYGVLVVDPAKHPHAKVDAATAFADWLVSEEGQDAIAAFRVLGQPLFFPNAVKGAAE
jgi:tungstate transport system substrate-binding protein